MKEKIKKMAYSVKEIIQDMIEETDKPSFNRGFYFGWLLYGICDIVSLLIVAAFKKRRGA